MPEVVVPVVALVMIFGSIPFIVYLTRTATHRERMALIEKGESAKIFEFQKKQSEGSGALKWGLVAVFVRLGLFVANVMASMSMFDEDVVYPAMILLFGGSGSILYHLINQKQQENKRDKQIN